MNSFWSNTSLIFAFSLTTYPRLSLILTANRRIHHALYALDLNVKLDAVEDEADVGKVALVEDNALPIPYLKYNDIARLDNHTLRPELCCPPIRL